MTSSEPREERWEERGCAPGEHRFIAAGTGHLLCAVCRHTVRRAALLCEVCGDPALLLLTRPATRHRTPGMSSVYCGRCFDDFALYGVNRGRRGHRGY